MADLNVLRDRMVEAQLRARGISDGRVLAAFKKVERHKFVPEELALSAYEDCPLPIGESQTISQPYMVALMTELLALKGGEKVLEIGSGSGYQLAILLELAKEAYSVERVSALAKSARQNLERLGYKNFTIIEGDGTLGYAPAAPYDAIVVTAGTPRVPPSLIEQLKSTGRLVAPVGGAFSQALTLVEKQPGRMKASEVCGCVFVPLIGKEGWSK